MVTCAAPNQALEVLMNGVCAEGGGGGGAWEGEKGGKEGGRD